MLEREQVEAFSKSRYVQRPAKPAEVNEPVQTLFSDAALQTVVNVASVPKRSPFRYPGGKTWLIPYARLWLQSLKKPPKMLVEPFAGGGSIGLTAGFEGLARKVRLVELDPDIASVWRVCLNGQIDELCDLIRDFKCEPGEVQEAISRPYVSELDHAFQTIVRNRVSRGGILAPGAGLVKEGEAGKGIASRWYPETIVKRIQEINKRAETITFEEGDGLDAIAKDACDPSVALFVDPPYPKAGRRLYRFHDIDHRKLFELLQEVKGPLLVTYDHSQEIQALADEFGFDSELVPMKSTHHERKFELLISRVLDWFPTRQAPD
jgi:DNA adenine methylase